MILVKIFCVPPTIRGEMAAKIVEVLHDNFSIEDVTKIFINDDFARSEHGRKICAVEISGVVCYPKKMYNKQKSGWLYSRILHFTEELIGSNAHCHLDIKISAI